MSVGSSVSLISLAQQLVARSSGSLPRPHTSDIPPPRQTGSRKTPHSAFPLASRSINDSLHPFFRRYKPGSGCGITTCQPRVLYRNPTPSLSLSLSKPPRSRRRMETLPQVTRQVTRYTWSGERSVCKHVDPPVEIPPLKEQSLPARTAHRSLLC